MVKKLLLLLLPVFPLFSGDYTLTGNWKTPDAVIRRIIGRPPAGAERALWLDRVRDRLDSTGVFFPVLVTNRDPEPGAPFAFTVRDKWTAVPVFGYKRGGEVQVTRLGAADDNFLGTMAVVNLYADLLKGYGSNEGRESVSLSFMAEWVRFLGWNLMMDLQRYDTVSPATLYDGSGRVVGTHLYERREYFFGIGRELLPDFFLKLQAAFVDDRAVDRSGLSLSEFGPERSRRREYSLQLLLDRARHREYLSRGSRFELTGGIDSDGAARLIAGLRHYRLDRNNNNLALSLQSGWTDGSGYGRQFLLGGTDSLRGFYHQGLVSRRYMLGSMEYRLHLGNTRLFGTEWLFWQINLFTDAGLLGQTVPEDTAGFAGSIGMGLRVATLPISNNLLRIDLAWGYYPYRRLDVVVATRHYF